MYGNRTTILLLFAQKAELPDILYTPELNRNRNFNPKKFSSTTYYITGSRKEKWRPFLILSEVV